LKRYVAVVQGVVRIEFRLENDTWGPSIIYPMDDETLPQVSLPGRVTSIAAPRASIIGTDWRRVASGLCVPLTLPESPSAPRPVKTDYSDVSQLEFS
jgi:hypothetical protein